MSFRVAVLGVLAGVLVAATAPPSARAQVEDSAPTAAPEAPASSLDALLDAFAAMPGLEARFVEEKTIGLLAVPLVSEGTLYFTRPGLLYRRVESPSPAEVRITPTTLEFFDGVSRETVDLAARPDVRLFVQSLVWILAGDRAALGGAFDASYTVDGDRWTARFAPKVAPMNELIEAIELSGVGRGVATITVRETSGDVAVTRIVDANPARVFSSDERVRLFGEASR
ncbi:MAG: outer membrane lipoprotein carrier protein LolA [Myxococcales bacterium]|nr:outer membrane lipoprotein carrier protein LolA [Myxococcales bacterium]MCB9520177.1 outer membrane lipoprotein carrier protein LolA [Myxococcales bacterium]MCB9531201.1 outer membrane lipoprotein carrier protein LolA [Myxococcales bacterium]